MTDPKIIEAAAEELAKKYYPDSTKHVEYQMFDRQLQIMQQRAFKAGYAKASKDMVPREVVQKLVDALQRCTSAHMSDGRFIDVSEAALEEFQTWEARRG